MRIFLCVFAVSLFFTAVVQCNSGIEGGTITVDTASNQFVDQAGRLRYFHGVNVIMKGEPWYPVVDKFDPFLSFSEEDMQNLEAWGMNTIRLGMMWPGAEPAQGEFNNTYLQVVKGIAETAKKHGIYSLLDFHQDCLAAQFCGEGIPQWAVMVNETVLPFPEPFAKAFSRERKPPVPTWQNCTRLPWMTYQATAAASSAYQNLYSDTYVRSSFVNFWKRVVSDYLTDDNILGYEIMNEPWAGDIYAHPTYIVPGVADEKNLAPFYDAVVQGIREIDEDHIVMFESVTWDDVKCGFKQVPGGEIWQNRSALSYHFYRPPNFTPKQMFGVRTQEIQEMHTGGFLTEFDLCNKEDKLVEVMDEADRHLISWQGWEYKPFVPITGVCNPFYNENGTINYDRVKLVSRTYPTAVAGRDVSFVFHNSNSSFILSYVLDENIKLPTEIYYNHDLRYNNGVELTVEPQGAAETVLDLENIVKVHHNPGFHGERITITLDPR